MIGRVYRWRGEFWRVVTRWRGNDCPRNVLLERVHSAEPYMRPGVCVMWTYRCVDGRYWFGTGEQVVRPFRGLRRLP